MKYSYQVGMFSFNIIVGRYVPRYLPTSRIVKKTEQCMSQLKSLQSNFVVGIDTSGRRPYQ